MRFTHPLVATSLYELAGPERRRAVHGRLADLAEDPEERARHLAVAVYGRSPEAGAALEQATRHVVARGGTAAAADLAHLAVEATPEDDREALVRRRLLAAEALITAGELPRARELLDDLLRELGPSRERASARFLLATTRSDDLEAATALTTRALFDTGDDHALRAAVNHHLALLWRARGELQRALAHAQAARAAAETVGEPHLSARVLSLLALLETLASPTVDAGVLDLALELEGETERPAGGYSPRLVLGIRLLLAGDLDDARAALEADHGEALASGDQAGLPLVLAQLAELELRAGRWEEASRYAGEAVGLADQVGVPHVEAAVLAAQARVYARLGAVDDARTAAGRGARVAAAAKAGLAAVENAAALGFAELSAQRLHEADAHLRPLLTEPERMGVVDLAAVPFVVDAIDAMVERGAAEEARAHVEWVEACARDRPSHWALGAAHRSRGLWLAANGQLDEAEDAFRAAVREHEACGEPFEHARTLLALGTVLRRAKQKRAAREILDASLGVFDQLGASSWAERARAELARIGGRRPRSNGLTPTEQRVAELVAEGLSNKEVAAALHVTVKTVEGSLSRIYAKLDVRSRAGLASQLTGKEVTRAKS